MATEKRQVQVELDLGLGPNGVSMLKRLEGVIGETAKSYSMLAQAQSRFMMSGGGGGGGGVGQSPVGGHLPIPLAKGWEWKIGGNGQMVPVQSAPEAGTPEPGFVKSLAARYGISMPSTSAVARMGAIGATIDTGRRAFMLGADYYHNPYMTQGTYERSWTSMVPFGETLGLREGIDTLTGRSHKMFGEDVRAQMQSLRTGGYATQASIALAMNPAQAGREGLRAGYNNGGAVTLDYINRSTEAGRVEFAQAQRMLPVRRQIAQAEREASEASYGRVSAERELEKITARRNDLMQRIDKAHTISNRARAGTEWTEINGEMVLADQGPGLKKIMNQELDLRKQLEDLNLLADPANKLVVEKRTDEFNKQMGLVKANSEGLRAKADITEMKAAGMDRAGTTLGGMNPLDRQFQTMAMEAVLKYGPDGLPPEWVQAARATGSGAVEDVIRKAGLNDPTFRRQQELDPATFGAPGSTPEGLRESGMRLRKVADQQDFNAERAMANSAANFGTKLAEKLIELNRISVESTIQGIEAELTKQKNQ